MKTREEVAKLKDVDIYSLMLFALYKVKDIPEYATLSELAYILPRLTSCYRMQGSPQKAIDILSFASRKHGKQMITAALLISAAAAYCDLEEYVLAKKACDRANAMSSGKSDGELKAVYGRIKKESGKQRF